MENVSVVMQPNAVERATGKSQPEDNMGDYLVAAGKLKKDDIPRVIALQQEKNLRFGEAAVQLGLVSENDIQQILAEQFDYQYLSVEQGNFSNEINSAYQPFSPEAESMRKLRTQLQLRWFNQGNKGLVVMGPTGSEGASRLTANLAVTFAQSGKKTLLIDANMRNPRQHELFKLGRRPGLAEILGGRADKSCIVQAVGLDSLWILGSGATPPNPAELLVRPQLTSLLKEALETFDVVLVDVPAAIQAPDFQTVVANQIRGVLVVTRKSRSKFSHIDQLQEMISAVGSTVVGGVINHF